MRSMVVGERGKGDDRGDDRIQIPKDIYRTHPGHPVPVLFQKSVTQFVTSRPVAAAMGFAIDFDDQ